MIMKTYIQMVANMGMRYVLQQQESTLQDL